MELDLPDLELFGFIVLKREALREFAFLAIWTILADCGGFWVNVKRGRL